MKRYCCIFILFACQSAYLYANENESENELAKASLNGLKINHAAEHISVPFQEYFNFDYGHDNTQSILYLKPVVPFRIAPNLDLILRTIAPIYERTPTNNTRGNPDGHYVNGWGDINPTFFISPATFQSVIIGFGPTVSIPTATNNKYIGTGKWSLGPELALYYIGQHWMAGFLANNLWSIAGDAQRESVNNFEFEYLISYVFDNGWYINSNPTITANWKNTGDKRWIVPFGIGAGRAFKWNQQSINMSVIGNYNFIRPDQTGPVWQIQLQIEWLFPPVTILR